MKYLPFEDFEIHTTLTSDQVFYKLRAAVDTQRKWWIFTNKPFWGEVNRHYFRIWRPTWVNRNTNPVISGKVQPEALGSCVQIKMRLPWYSFFFWIACLGFLGYAFFRSIDDLIIQKIQTGIWQIASPWLLLPPIAVFAFLYFLGMFFYKIEVEHSIKYLLWLTETGKENIKYIDRIFGITEPEIIKSLFLVTVVASLGWIVYSLLW